MENRLNDDGEFLPDFAFGLSRKSGLARYRPSSIVCDQGITLWHVEAQLSYVFPKEAAEEVSLGTLQPSDIEPAHLPVHQLQSKYMGLIEECILSLSPCLCRLSQAVLRRAEAQVQPILQTMLSAIISGEPTDSVHKGDYHRLIFEVGCSTVMTLLLVYPLNLGVGVPAITGRC